MLLHWDTVPSFPMAAGVEVTYKSGQFTPIATGYVNKRVAIVLDNAVISAPVINQGITGDQVRISGSFGQSEAQNLALSRTLSAQ